MTQEEGPVQEVQSEDDGGADSTDGGVGMANLNSSLFVVLLIVALVSGAYLLVNVAGVVGSSPTTAPSATPSPTAIAEGTAGESPVPGKSGAIGPGPTELALNFPGDPVDVLSGGNMIGTVVVNQLRWPAAVAGSPPATGNLWLTADVTYDASEGDITYSTNDWTLVDDRGHVIQPAEAQKSPELGSGTVTTGKQKHALVTFLVPANTPVVLHLANGDTQAEYKVKPK